MNSQTLTEAQLQIIAQQLVQRIQAAAPSHTNKPTGIPVGISNRHIHLCQADIDALFGKDAELVLLKELSQPGQYAAKQVVTVVGPKGSISNVRVLGPARKQSQLEISKTDSFQLGIKAPVNESGDLTNAGSAVLVGPKGTVILNQGVIIAKRHIHMTPQDALSYGVSQGDIVAIRTKGEREVIFLDTVIRVSDSFQLECHLDTDEANAAGLQNGKAFVEIVKEI